MDVFESYIFWFKPVQTHFVSKNDENGSFWSKCSDTKPEGVVTLRFQHSSILVCCDIMTPYYITVSTLKFYYDPHSDKCLTSYNRW